MNLTRGGAWTSCNRIGSGPLLALELELACVVDTDAKRARETARGHASFYLG